MNGTETTKIFADRLSDLINEKQKPYEDIAIEADVGKGSISKYANDNSEAGINSLVKLAKYFGVSTDYLLGLTGIRSPNTKIRDICEYTGLSETSVEFFNGNIRLVSNLKEKAEERDNQFLNSEMKIAETKISIVNDILNSDDFHFALVNLSEYIVKSKEYIDGMSDSLNQETLDKKLFIKELYLDNLKLKYYEAVDDLSVMVKKICNPQLCLSTGLNIETSIERIHENIVDMVISFDKKESENNANNNQTE